MTASVWDDPELRVGGDYIKFQNPGDTVTGTVLAVLVHRFEDGKAAPQLILDTADGEKTVTAGQVRLKALLQEKRPQVGQTVTIVYQGEEKRAGGKTMKLFTLDVGGAAAPAPAPAAPAAAAPTLTAEQIEALKLIGVTPPQ